jgi:hypothetical protein
MRISKGMKRLIAKMGSSLVLRARQDIADVAALQRINRIVKLPDYFPWTSYALRPSAIECIVNDIIINKRFHIVEFGGGVSSLYIASVLNKHGGRMIIIDHDKAWLNMLNESLQAASIPEAVFQSVYAPLREQTFGNHTCVYYDKESISSAMGTLKVDAILVDGPPAKAGCMTRYPAMNIIHPILSENCIVYLDDIFRKDEYIIAKKWAKDFNFSLEMPEMIGGLAILRPKVLRGDEKIL